MSWDENEGMTLAVGPLGELIDIRVPGAYHDWKSRAGLKCPECNSEMHAYVSRRGNTFVRHTGGKERECRIAGVESGWRTMKKAVIKAWLVTYLKDRGFPAEQDVQVGSVRADVVTKFEGKPLAIQVTLDKLSPDVLQADARELSKNDHKVLWLAHNLHWFDRTPLLGISLRADPEMAFDDRLTVQYGFHVQANGGLVPEPGMTLRSFLDQYFRGRLYSGELEPGKTVFATHQSWHWYRLHMIHRLKRQNENLVEKVADAAAALRSAKRELAEEQSLRADASKAATTASGLAAALKLANTAHTETIQRYEGWMAGATRIRQANRFARFGLRHHPLEPATASAEDIEKIVRPSEPVAAVVPAGGTVLAAMTVVVSATVPFPVIWKITLFAVAAIVAGASSWLLSRTCWTREEPEGTICRKTRSRPFAVCEMRHHSATKFTLFSLLGAVTMVVGGLYLFVTTTHP
ncbi:hypothetical protein C6401_13760 [Arthrobacter woluwensis]|uniref:hypothetical protein n=1 Tax=Arthrobacter woluwensis TaxID=156980 RepID=UPI000D13545C|nr:hypothetical protein [Arthrobacter woluwensis]PSS43111.1 hypothetical protein C6401_13760 [Arthrobacter woluwensis]